MTTLICLTALPVCDQTPLSQPPPGLLSHVQAAKKLLQQGRRTDALAEFAKGGYLPSPTGIALFYYDWGAGHSSQGQFPAAITDYRRALHEDLAASPSIAGDLHWRLGDLLERRRQYAAAASQYRSGLRLGTSNVWTRALLVNLAGAQKGAGQGKAAHQLWEQVLATGDAEDRTLARRSLKSATW